jgi:hypothetical protein
LPPNRGELEVTVDRMLRSLSILLFLQVIASVAAVAQCQNQECVFNSNCYQCVDMPGVACSPGKGRTCPQSCTETRCASALQQSISSVGQTGSSLLPSTSSELLLQPAKESCAEQLAKGEVHSAPMPKEGVLTTAEWQASSPVHITQWTVAHNRDGNFVVKQLVMENIGPSTVVQYQLGFMLIFADKEPEIQPLGPVAVKLAPKAALTIGESAPNYEDDETVAKQQEDLFVNSSRNVGQAVVPTTGLRAINIFVMSLKRDGEPEFHENTNELAAQMKARLEPAKRTNP